MQFEYKCSGTCSQYIQFTVEDDKVHNVVYLGGCNGNLKGIGALVEGMDIDEVIARLEAPCPSPTLRVYSNSCPLSR